MAGCTQSYEIGKNPKLEDITDISATQSAMSMTDSFTFFVNEWEGGVHMFAADFYDYDEDRRYQFAQQPISDEDWQQLLSTLVGCTVEQPKEDDSGMVVLDATETSVQVTWPDKPADGYWEVTFGDGGKAYETFLDTLKALAKKHAPSWGVVGSDDEPDPYDVPGAGITLREVRGRAAEQNADVAIALIGDAVSRTWQECYQDSDYVWTYSFMDKIANDSNRVVMGEGLLLYCIVPVDRTSTVTVNSYAQGDEPQVLFKTEDGAPFFLTADAMGGPATEEIVIVRDGKEPIAFRPDFNAPDLIAATQGSPVAYNFSMESSDEE